MRRPLLLALAAASALCVRQADGASDAQVRVERVAGEPVAAQRLASIADGSVVLAAESGEVKLPLAEVIEIGFATPPDPPQAWSPSEVAVDLATGETILGEIKGGDEHGFTLASPLLGNVVMPLDRLAAVRFLQRLSLIPEPPDLRAAEPTDVVHLAGGDRMTCTIDSFSAKSVTVESTTGEKVSVAYERVTAIRVTGDAGKRPAGTLLVAVLRDGSQTIGSAPSVKDGRLRMKSVAGFDVDAALTDVVAAHVVSDRFAYLSDLPASKLEVTPFWKSVAGDPNVLYAPRMDRSFTGRPLRCGGRTWVKGLGVYSGTSMTWALDGRFSEFRATAGLDDGAGPLGGVVFEVLVDGAVKWSSGYLRGASVAEGHGKQSPADAPHLDVKGAKTLTLRVLAGDAEEPWPVADEADWLGAMLVR
jgi:hypothetical protein